MELIVLGVIFCLGLGFAAGWYYNGRVMINALVDMVKDQFDELTHEIVDNVHFLYYVESRAFASQGATIDEAAENYGKITKNQTVGHVQRSATGAEFFIVNGKIETMTDNA
jgi:hypothetical protein